MQCPICNGAVWISQRYCPTCDNYLPHPGEENHFCPRCGLRVASQEDICHKCKAPLREIAGTPSTALARAWRRPLKGLSIFLGTGLIIAALLLIFLSKKNPGPPQLMVTPPPLAASEQPPATSLIPPAETAPSPPAVQESAVPSAPASPSPPEVTTPSPPVYFVNIPGLALRDGPPVSALQISTLYYKDEVELLETSGEWGRVRDLRRNIVGWSAVRFLQPVAADGSRALPQPEPPSRTEQEPISSKAPKDM